MTGQPRHHQQDQAAGDDQVPVALEDEVVLEQDDRRHEEEQADDEPVRLIAGEGLVDPVEHHQPDRREQGDEREQVRVGVGQPDAQEDVRGEADREEVRAEDQARVVELVAARRRRPTRSPRSAGRRRGRGRLAPCCGRSTRAPGRALARRAPPGAAAVPSRNRIVGLVCESPGAGRVVGGAGGRLRRRLEVRRERAGVVLGAPLVVGRDAAAVLGQRLEGGVGRLLLGVEVDAERQLVGKAAVDRDLVVVVDAEEPDLADAGDGGEGDEREDRERDDALEDALRPRGAGPGIAGGARSRRRGGGAAAARAVPRRRRRRGRAPAVRPASSALVPTSVAPSSGRAPASRRRRPRRRSG